MANTTFINRSVLEASKFRINTQHFSPHDLSLFVESLETITRLTLLREERKEHKKILKLSKVNKKCSTLPRIESSTTLNSTGTTSDETDEELLLLENKKVRQTPDCERSEYDETYFSATSSAQSSPRNSAIYNKKKLCEHSCQSTYSILTNSDSEESGVFPIGSSQHDIFELQTTTMRPRSKLITKSRTLSTKSRLINMVRKKDNNLAPVKLISCRALDEYETLKIHEQQQQQTDLQPETVKLSRFSTLHMKKKSRQKLSCSDGLSEERFLNKALRYLTL